MPEPNLPPLRLHVCEGKENVHNLVDVPLLKKRIAELPEQTREDLLTKYKVSPDFVKVLVVSIINDHVTKYAFCRRKILS